MEMCNMLVQPDPSVLYQLVLVEKQIKSDMMCARVWMLSSGAEFISTNDQIKSQVQQLLKTDCIHFQKNCLMLYI